MNKFWQVSNNEKISYDELYSSVVENISIIEVKLIWYLRRSQIGIVTEFLHLAKKFYEVNKAKATLNSLLIDEIKIIPTI